MRFPESTHICKKHTTNSGEYSLAGDKTLTIFLYHPTICFKGKEYVKPHHGKFIDGIAPAYERVYLVARYLKEGTFPAWMLTDGKPMYDYELTAGNVILTRGFSSRLSYPFRFFQQLFYLLRTDHSLFFTPSVASVVLYPFLVVLRKRYFCYIAADIRNYLVAKFGDNALAALAYKMHCAMIRASAGILATGQKNLSSFQQHKKAVRVLPLLNIEKPANDQENLYNRITGKLLYVGTLSPNKRIHLILEAVQRLVEGGKDVTLDLIGTYAESDADYFHSIKQQARELVAEKRVTFHGVIIDQELLARFYREAEYLLLVSESEGFPKVIYEAMMFGTVPILSRIESYDGFLSEGQNCRFVEGDIPAQIVDVIEKTTQDKIAAIRNNNLELVDALLKGSASKQFLSLAFEK